MATGKVTNITEAGKGAPFRSAPDASTRDNIVGVLEPDTVVTLFGYENGWYYAECEGVQGYVAGEFIQALDGIGEISGKLQDAVKKAKNSISKNSARKSNGNTFSRISKKSNSNNFSFGRGRKNNSEKPVKSAVAKTDNAGNAALICPHCGAMYSVTALNGLGSLGRKYETTFERKARQERLKKAQKASGIEAGYFVCPKCGQKFALTQQAADAANATATAEKVQEAAEQAQEAVEKVQEAVATAPNTNVAGLGSLKSLVNKVATSVSNVASKLTNTAEKATAVSEALNNPTAATTTTAAVQPTTVVVQQPATTQTNNTDMDEAKKATIKKVAIIGGIAVGLGTIAIIAVKKSKKNSAAPAQQGKLNGFSHRKHRRGKKGKKSSCKVINLK